MAKKIVRGITDVKTINNQDYDTNNVNDLLSDGQYNYIHRKKGETEEYHNLTDNIKTISSDNTDLLTVTNNNKTTNTATLSPKHDAQKEQVLESTRNTIAINHGTNGTAETTKIDVNTQKVLTHNNLVSSSPLLTIEHQDGQDTTTIKAENLQEVLQQLYQAISSIGGGTTTTIKYSHSDGRYQLFKYVFKDKYKTFVTYTFNVNSGTPQLTFVVPNAHDLEKFVRAGMSVSNGAISITNDGTTIKVTNSKSTEDGNQQGTFTFYEKTEGGGGGGV